MLDIEVGLWADWETGDGVGAGAVAEGEDAEVQAGTASQAWTVVLTALAGWAGW